MVNMETGLSFHRCHWFPRLLLKVHRVAKKVLVSMNPKNDYKNLHGNFRSIDSDLPPKFMVNQFDSLAIEFRVLKDLGQIRSSTMIRAWKDSASKAYYRTWRKYGQRTLENFP